MPVSPSPFQRLAPELLMRICLLCSKEDLLNVSNSCKSAQSVARLLRWRTVVVKSTNYLSFREWLLLFGHSRPTPLDAFFRSIPGLDGTVAIDPIAEEEISEYVRTIVLPEKWADDTTSFVRILAAMKPRHLTAVVFGKSGDGSWYSDMEREWTLPTMDDMMERLERLELINPPRSSLHFVLARVPSSVGRPLYSFIKSIQLKSAPVVDNHWGSQWDPVDEHSALDYGRIFMVAETLEVDLSDGLRALLEQIYFPALLNLTVFTRRNMSHDWSLLERLLGDASSTLEVFHLCRGSSIDYSSTFKDFACSLVNLEAVVVHWPVISLLDGFHSFVLPGQADLIVQNYDANTAEESDYTRASPILQLPHWRRVAFTQDPLPDGSDLPPLPPSTQPPMLSNTLFKLRNYARAAAPETELANAAALSCADRATLGELQVRLRSALHDCDDELRRLESVKKELARQLCVTKGLNAPVRLLTDDTLRLVFLSLARDLEDPFHCAPYFATTICVVSRRWRNIARETVSLWTSLALRHSRPVFENGSHRRTLPWEHFSNVTPLCQLAPLHVRWNWELELSPLVDFMSDLHNTIRTLELRAQWDSLAVLTSPCFHSLHRLKLSLRGDDDRFALQMLSKLRKLHSLHIVSIDGISRHEKYAAPSMPTLRDLVVHAYPGPPFKFAHDLLVNCNLITALDLRCNFVDGSPQRNSATIFLPSLAILALAESASALLWFLCAPATETVRLSFLDDGYVHHSVFATLSTFLALSRCALKSLSFVYTCCTAQESDLSGCVERLGTLHTLAIDSSWDVPRAAPFGIAVVRYLVNNSAALPALRKVSFRGRSNHAWITTIIDHFMATRNGRSGMRRIEYDETELVVCDDTGDVE
uniref:F-box domain-containing protein n=1 Tax=Schizophyllum commune (strain H4-8 / FGSC 9210) TaxID=578458 RepID=D8Q7E8_SCHCM